MECMLSNGITVAILVPNIAYIMFYVIVGSIVATIFGNEFGSKFGKVFGLSSYLICIGMEIESKHPLHVIFFIVMLILVICLYRYLKPYMTSDNTNDQDG
ncbi:MAG: hypothetical protein J6A58_09065 [Oscillospiraceae bacterium]|nr:hypothetical protein [Oscillospiraceae bacterium]